LRTRGLPGRFVGSNVGRSRALVGFDRGADQSDRKGGSGKEQHDGNGHPDQCPPHHAPCLFCLTPLCFFSLRQSPGSVGLRRGHLFKLLALGVLSSRLGFVALPNKLVV
jgi:hypothetical protein